jgi:hypothetical protein
MDAMDHRSNGGRWSDCVWCHEAWPCTVARVRRELADLITSQVIGSTGDADYDNGREAGMQSAADLINVDGA